MKMTTAEKKNNNLLNYNIYITEKIPDYDLLMGGGNLLINLVT